MSLIEINLKPFRFAVTIAGWVRDFKAWLRQISQHVAEASKEGGFFGSGSGPVSDKQKATLQQISSALKLAA